MYIVLFLTHFLHSCISKSVNLFYIIFSQSLFTLSLIEELLSKLKVPRSDQDEYWCKNKNYFSKS